MEDPQKTDTSVSNPTMDHYDYSNLDTPAFGGLQFQVSDVVERLEAGVNSRALPNEDQKSEPHTSTGSFEPEPTTLDSVLKILEDIVKSTNSSTDSEDLPWLRKDNVSHASILSHSLAAFLSGLERNHAARLGAHIASETTVWLTHMFRLTDYHAYYHQENLEGLVKVVRMLLHHRYPRYLEDGAFAFSNRLPCIYSSVASPLGIVQHLCRQLGLPLACVHPVPVHSSGQGMDLEILERLCEEDTQAGRCPLLVLADAGAPPLGSAENLRALSAICTARKLYLYVRGHALALPAILTRSQIFSIADSLTLTPGLWFGVSGLPIVTLYKIPEPVSADISKPVSSAVCREGTLAALAGLSGGTARMPALPLWCTIRSAGARSLVNTIAAAFASARAVYRIISSTKGLVLRSDRPGGDEPPTAEVIDAIINASCCVVWQFATKPNERPVQYYDKLNTWLGQVLQREANMISLEVCETESFGVVIRYCPLEGVIMDEKKIPDFVAVLDAQLQILEATVTLKEIFQKKVEDHPELKLIPVPGWAGLGGVQYVPKDWINASVEELNELNKQLVETLRATDGAFSCGESEDGIACVRFGMVTSDTDVGELFEFVIAAGKEMVESSRALTTMSEVLKKGIEEAQADLERENAERLWQEGLLRRVPVVGAVARWWAPTPPAPLGRRLHLHHGHIQRTDDVIQAVQKKNPEVPPSEEPPSTQ